MDAASKPLTGDEVESSPFLVADHPPNTGPTGSVDGYYYWSGNLPANQTGRHQDVLHHVRQAGTAGTARTPGDFPSEGHTVARPVIT
ncbi:hypothetical protein GCM10023191_030400 [Actinoallomurus oryzae]|uniref:Uncharacterized protein n=1 Tax=Actinoallomurus oryzae TaxID=502180 RepID=A0ABP8PWS5_9ACTN